VDGQSLNEHTPNAFQKLPIGAVARRAIFLRLPLPYLYSLPPQSPLLPPKCTVLEQNGVRKQEEREKRQVVERV
jgi:hypothetical protein